MGTPTELEPEPTAVSEADLRLALDHQLLANLRAIVTGLVALFALLAVVNPFAARGMALRWVHAPTFMLFYELGVLAAFATILVALRRGLVSPARGHAVAFVLALLPLADTLLHTWFKADPLETLGFTMLLFGVAFFYTSPAWFAAFTLLALAAWAGVAALALPAAALPSLWVVVAQAAVLAGVMFAVRYRAQRRLEALRILAERRGAQLDRQNRRLRELDALKGAFVSAVSHDLRTPLTSIRGYAEFLEDGIGGELTADQAAYVAQIMRAGARLEYLVDDLLDFARIEAGTFRLRWEEGELVSKAHEIAESLRPMVQEAGQTLAVEAADPAAAVPVWMDARRVGQVLTNLLTNAIKFTPPGGDIALTVRRDADKLRCEVRDSGAGIAPEDLPRLFQRFSQLDGGRAKGGTGLGLSISKAIVEAHGGEIGVESTPGAGSTFWFTLPLGPETEGPAPIDAGPRAAEAAASRRPAVPR